MRKRIDERLPNRHEIVIGASGSGKSSYIKQHPEVRDAQRLLIWDPDHEYRVTHTARREQLRAACAKAGFGPLRLAFSPAAPTREDFDFFCSVAFAMGHAAAPLVVIVEELADVTGSGKASDSWGALVRRARKYGVKLICASQRPQEIDKTVFSQCGTHWCGVLRTPRDRVAMAGVLGVTPADLESIKPLEYFLKDGNGKPERRKVTFK